MSALRRRHQPPGRTADSKRSTMWQPTSAIRDCRSAASPQLSPCRRAACKSCSPRTNAALANESGGLAWLGHERRWQTLCADITASPESPRITGTPMPLISLVPSGRCTARHPVTTAEVSTLGWLNMGRLNAGPAEHGPAQVRAGLALRSQIGHHRFAVVQDRGAPAGVNWGRTAGTGQPDLDNRNWAVGP